MDLLQDKTATSILRHHHPPCSNIKTVSKVMPHYLLHCFGLFTVYKKGNPKNHCIKTGWHLPPTMFFITHSHFSFTIAPVILIILLSFFSISCLHFLSPGVPLNHSSPLLDMSIHSLRHLSCSTIYNNLVLPGKPLVCLMLYNYCCIQTISVWRTNMDTWSLWPISLQMALFDDHFPLIPSLRSGSGGIIVNNLGIPWQT